MFFPFLFVFILFVSLYFFLLFSIFTFLSNISFFFFDMSLCCSLFQRVLCGIGQILSMLLFAGLLAVLVFGPLHFFEKFAGDFSFKYLNT